MIYKCCSEERRKLVKEHPWLNGIDFIEVLDNPSDPPEVRQTNLLVHFIKDISSLALTKENIIIEGGERITNIKVLEVNTYLTESPPTSPPLSSPIGDLTKILKVKVHSTGDFSIYKLQLVKNLQHKTPPDGFDPVLSSVEFSFKVSCPNNFDCKTTNECTTLPDEIPDINYLAKDYNSFRQIMLDRLSLLLPDWQESSPANLGITIVELLAYVGDHLSYQQDAIATEAYIGTARKRISVKRHARLVDYYMHDGCNARAWVQIVINPAIDNINLQSGQGMSKTKFVTYIPEKSTVINYNSEDYEDILHEDVQFFELMHNSKLYSEHNTIKFYTWGEKECCLPKGATAATLLGNLSNLKVGDVLIFTEVKGSETGATEDADPSHRHAVRLTEINLSFDPIGSTVLPSPLSSPPGDGSIPVTEIKWHIDDALPFPLCISSCNGNVHYNDVSIALGNIVLVDHGLTWVDSNRAYSLKPYVVPAANPILSQKSLTDSEPCETPENKVSLPRYRPVLTVSPLTHTAIYKHQQPFPSAKSVMKWPLTEVRPEIILIQENDNSIWEAKRDLLNSNHDSKHFVVEIESDGVAHLRFGNNFHGAMPISGKRFKAIYRLGNGTIGNIGAEKLAHIVSNDSNIYSNSSYITKIWNPLPAKGGQEPENIEEVRQKAGYAFQQQERAVTPEDYAYLAKKSDSSVQRATANYRWTGSWYTSFVTFDRFGGKKVNKTFEDKMIKKLNLYRMAGQDLKIDNPLFVPLKIEMEVCLEKNYFASDVKKAILSVFTNSIMKNGKPGLFHPDNFTFGQTLYLSTYYAVAQAIPGVKSVNITKFQRQGITNDEALETGKLSLGLLEIARLDNDPNFKENGILNIIIR